MIPDVVGMRLELARRVLEDSGINIETVEPSQPPEGTGRPFPPDTKTDIYVAMAWETESGGARLRVVAGAPQHLHEHHHEHQAEDRKENRQDGAHEPQREIARDRGPDHGCGSPPLRFGAPPQARAINAQLTIARRLHLCAQASRGSPEPPPHIQFASVAFAPRWTSAERSRRFHGGEMQPETAPKANARRLTVAVRRKIVRPNPVKLRAWRAAGANFTKNPAHSRRNGFRSGGGGKRP